MCSTMAKKWSAGILLYRKRDRGVEVFLVHPGGPFWDKKDHGAWSIPKGLYESDEDPLVAARREFTEETGAPMEGTFVPLLPLTQASGKVVLAWAVEGDIDATTVKSNTFSMEWPPRSGRVQAFPEVDRAGWFDLATARMKLQRGQHGFLDQLEERLQKTTQSAR